MGETFPRVAISPEHLAYLISALLVYQHYRQCKTPPTDERAWTLLGLTFLLPKLQRGIEPHKDDLPLVLTVDEVRLIKGGLAMMLDHLQRKPATRTSMREMDRLRLLKKLFDESFSTTQD